MIAETVSIVPLSSTGEILLMLRDDKGDIPFPNMWATLGGAVERDEDPRTAAERELREEIGRTIDNLTYTRPVDTFSDMRQSPVRIHVYYGHVDTPAEDLKLGEGQRLQWFRLEDLATLDLAPPSRAALAAVFAAVGWTESSSLEA
ncbi:MAG: NUDIX domain-containing protein [Chloroflexi bacterium]|nr:NUDIX domain-containing protein [Chloroflexota bacterium]